MQQLQLQPQALALELALALALGQALGASRAPSAQCLERSALP